MLGLWRFHGVTLVTKGSAFRVDCGGQVRGNVSKHTRCCIYAQSVCIYSIRYRSRIKFQKVRPDIFVDFLIFRFQGKNGIPLVAGRRRGDVELMMNDDNWLK